MIKEQILDDIRSRFLKALDEKYESFSISLDRRGDLLVMRVSGAHDGYKAFSYDFVIHANVGIYGPAPHQVEELEKTEKK
jgi:hypothetical protein